LYGLRNWVEVSDKQVKHPLGWADFQVRKDRAIRRHWELVCCAFVFCWWDWFRNPREAPPGAATAAWGEKSSRRTAGRERGCGGTRGFLAAGGAAGTGVAGPVDAAVALVASVDRLAPATGTPGVA
jgi:hypothetical protein